jgi:WD40 repeat protein
MPLQTYTNRVSAVAWSPDGASIVSGSLDGDLRIWDAATGQCRMTLQGHTARVEAVAWSPDSASIVSGSLDSGLRIWDVATGQCRVIIELFPEDDYAVWHGDGTLQSASKMAWQYLGWQTTANGKLETLPAEIFGRLPS